MSKKKSDSERIDELEAEVARMKMTLTMVIKVMVIDVLEGIRAEQGPLAASRAAQDLLKVAGVPVVPQEIAEAMRRAAAS